MISVRGQAERKEAGLGLCVQEHMELEEGETSFPDDDFSFDPDIKLSYIGEKVQNLLGHFQKDFEGEVSAENLGAKFGGYGSFLPAYPRSPVSCVRSPLRSRKSDPLRPEAAVFEDKRVASSIPSSAPCPKLEIDNSTKAPNLLPSSKQDVHFDPTNILENKSSIPNNQKMLRVRLKVGSDKILNSKSAEIYSGLGLDVSPSSSLDDNDTESEGLAINHPVDGFNESPTSILQLMTSSPLQGEMLLSPLCDDILDLTVRDKLISFVGSDRTDVQDNYSVNMASGTVITKHNEKMVPKSEPKKENYHILAENDRNNCEMENRCSLDTNISTDKIPLLSNSFSSKERREKLADTFSDIPREVTQSKLIRTENTGRAEQPIGKTSHSKSEKIQEGRSVSSQEINTVCPSNGFESKGHRSFEDARTNANSSTGGRACESSAKIKSGQKNAPCSVGKIKDSNCKHVSEFGETRKSKGSRIGGNVDVPREGSLSLQRKNTGKRVDDSRMLMTVKEKKLKTEECFKKITAADKYRDFFGDPKPHEHNGLEISDSLQDRHKDSNLRKEHISEAKERLHKKDVLKLSKDTPATECTDVGPIKDTGSNYDMIPASVNTTVIQELWVCCDKCSKWRLLPHGITPESLPDKWICEMLDWLPGMNRCSISEDDTTKAQRTSYQGAAPESQNPSGYVGGIDSTGALANVQHPARDDHFHAEPGAVKRTHGGPGKSNATDGDACTQFSNDSKKKLQVLVKHKKNTESRKLSAINEDDLVTQSTDLVVLHKHRQNEKHLLSKSRLDRGESKIKLKSKSETNEDSPMFSKKGNLESRLNNADGLSKQDGAFLKASTSGPAANPTVRNVHESHRSYSKKLDCDRKDRMQDLNKQTKVGGMKPKDSNPKFIRGQDNQDFVKKRKLIDSRSSNFYLESDQHDSVALDDGRCSVREEFSETEPTKGKIVKLQKCEKEEPRNETNRRVSNKVFPPKDRKAGEHFRCTSPQSLDYSESFKKNSKNLQHSFATASSSSKVSGSHRREIKFHDSPVESVSSSPLRTISNVCRSSSSQRGVMGKDGCHHGAFSANDCSRQSSGRDDLRADQSGALKKNKCSSITLHKQQDSPALDCQGSVKSRSLHLSDHADDHPGLVQSFPYKDPLVVDKFDDEERMDGSHDRNPKRFSNIPSGPSKDKKHALGDAFDIDKLKVPRSVTHSLNETWDFADSYRDKAPGRRKQSKSNCEADKVESVIKNHGKSSCMIHSSDDRTFNPSPNVNKAELVSGNRKPQYLPHALESQGEMMIHSGSGSRRGTDINASSVDKEGICNVVKHDGRIDNLNGSHHTVLRKDSSNQAISTALREAKNLKHMADRLKSAGSDLESSGLYFQAALKFLSAASLLESCDNDCSRQEDPKQIYGSTAKLCEFCVNEYERFKDMASASLAYKCIEVAYMRAVYSSNASATRDRHELEASLHMNDQGESPSSSASDVDNLNNVPASDKLMMFKGATPPQVTGNHVVAAQNQPNYGRLLTFAHDVNLAMEASKKSRAALAAAAADGLMEIEALTAVRAALDFNFQDMEGFLRLVRLALEAIGRG